MNNFTIFVIALVVGLGGLVWWASTLNSSPELSFSAQEAQALTADDHIAGNANAQVVLMEYLDFECPACAAYHPVIEEVKAQYGDRVAFVTRHFPLFIHPNARNAAYAAEAAAKQGRFGDMADRLFENQREWARGSDASETFENYAVAMGLNMDQYRADVDSAEARNKVDSDLEKGKAMGVNSTPSFYLNGQKIDNPSGADALRALLSEALGENQELLQAESDQEAQ